MCMAGENNTVVTLHNTSKVYLQMGQTTFVSVKQSDTIQSNKPLQVVLVTGDEQSESPETRWFTMRSIETYQSEYVTPVGDHTGLTRVVIYNPGPKSLDYTVTHTAAKKSFDYGGKLDAKQSVYTRIIQDDTGALIKGNGNFVALSITDTSTNPYNETMTPYQKSTLGK
jgi:hypothetical protein